MPTPVTSTPSKHPTSWPDVFAVFLKLGLTSFGGPVAHIGYFRREFVDRRRWLTDEDFTDLVGLCQFLPGPASSQVGFSVGLLRAGWRGAAAAWCGFTLPSVFLLIAFAALAPRLGGPIGEGLLHGLKLTAVAVVAQAVWDMARRLCPDHRRAGIALLALGLLSVLNTVYAQLLTIACGAALGYFVCRAADSTAPAHPAHAFHVSRKAGIIALLLFLMLLLGLPALSGLSGSRMLSVFDGFYRSGALVFGGGHVVLPLLQARTVDTGWVSPNAFLAGYGAAQAVPGPLFTFAAFLGWSMNQPPDRWIGSAIATIGIFLPGMLLVIATLPFWQALRARPSMAAALAGVNAAVVGLLAGALYSPVWTSAVHSAADFAIAAAAFVLLVRFRIAPLAIVAFCALLGIAEAFWM